MRRRTGSDDDLIGAVQRGDNTACAELTIRHRRWVTRLLLSFTRDADEAEDLTQDVFTRMYRHAGSYRTRGGFIVWLRRIAVNVGNSFLARRTVCELVPAAALDDLPAKSSFDPLVAVLERSLESAVREAIITLPTEQRDALLMRCFLGLTVPEIAARQKCPEGTVKSRLSIGMGRIRGLLADYATIDD